MVFTLMASSIFLMITLYRVHVVLGFSPENVSQQPLAGLLPPFFPFFPFPPSFLLSPLVCLFRAERTQKPEEGPGLVTSDPFAWALI